MIGVSRNSPSVFCMKWRKNVSRCHSVENDTITNKNLSTAQYFTDIKTKEMKQIHP